ncbi:MAG: aminotransferase class V-fold PLP-dependent enzyme [Paracoccaceae bacterium]
MFDIEKCRADTPACENILHFNNAGASLMPDPVYRALTGHLALERDRGGYEAAHAAAALAAFYTEFAALLGCDPSEIAFVENATCGWDMAFYGLPLASGDRILTHGSEYASNYLAFLQQAKRRSLAIDVVPPDPTGQIDLAAMEAMIGPRTRLIAITHVPSQGGLVNPAEAVGAVAARHGLLYLLDACQSAGQIDLNVRRIGCHMLSGTGRKFLRGPRGTGFLYVSNAILDRLDPPFLDLHSAEWIGPDSYTIAPGARRFENWESNVAGKIGLATAAAYARAIGLPAIEARVAALAALLRDRLADTRGITVHDLGTRKCGIVTFRSSRETPEAMTPRLAAMGINTSVSPATYAQRDLGARGLTSLVRASVHYYNTEAEVDRFVAALA